MITRALLDDAGVVDLEQRRGPFCNIATRRLRLHQLHTAPERRCQELTCCVAGGDIDVVISFSGLELGDLADDSDRSGRIEHAFPFWL